MYRLIHALQDKDMPFDTNTLDWSMVEDAQNIAEDKLDGLIKGQNWFSGIPPDKLKNELKTFTQNLIYQMSESDFGNQVWESPENPPAE